MRLLIVAALLMIGGAAHGVPVVPSFSQGSMTSRTETRSSVTEVINSMDYSTGYSWSASGHNVNQIQDHYLLAQVQHPAALVMEYRQNGRT